MCFGCLRAEVPSTEVVIFSWLEKSRRVKLAISRLAEERLLDFNIFINSSIRPSGR